MDHADFRGCVPSSPSTPAATGGSGAAVTGGRSGSGGAAQTGGATGTPGSGGAPPSNTGGAASGGAAGTPGTGGGGVSGVDAAVDDAGPPASDARGTGGTSVTGGAGGAGAGGRGGAGAPIGGAAGAGSGTGSVVVSTATDGKQTIMAPYNAPPEATRKAGVPMATLEKFVFSTSQIFPNTSRNVNIFIPAQYVAGTVVPFMVIQDGDEQLQSFKTDIVMENLIFQKRLPVMAAVFVHNPDNFGSQRSLEYDCLDADYSNFVLNELLPEVKRRHPELNLTTDPNGRGALGKSSGGPASFTLGWLHPELFQRIVTFNGSFVNICRDGTGAAAYPNLIRMTDPAKPLRVYLFSGSADNGGFAAGNQAMADALMAKGYPWRYVYGEGAAHGNNFGASLMTEALLWAWKGYPL
ncbi:MAG: alpha/beta hydrolase-fold protein [Pseudomonadota bacterium]